MGKAVLFGCAFAVAMGLVVPVAPAASLIEHRAGETLAAVEMDQGDTLHFTLGNGERRTLVVESTEARVVLTNLPQLKKGFHAGETIYEMSCRVRVDGHRMTMRRYVPVQQSFYEPHVINGMRIWFDGVRDIEKFLNDNHGGGLPRKDVRFAVQDMTLPICPQTIRPWYPNSENSIDVVDSYNANDVWMGPYQGADLHGGLDINMPIGTPLWAPIDFDTQFYFNSLKMGQNNNRWRGVRTWDNGQRWVLQAHHIVQLLVPQNTPLKQNTHYAEAAGVLTGSHAHSHFVFKVGADGNETALDAWIIFWQIFESNKLRAGEIRAVMQPLSRGRTGQNVQFDGASSNAGPNGNELRCRWTFGDGGTSIESRPRHIYTERGIYPVTLTVHDGVKQTSCTQHVTVDEASEKNNQPALILESPDAVTFRRRPPAAMDVYGWEAGHEPRTLRFTARPRSSPRPATQTVLCRNAGGGQLAEPRIDLRYREGRGWLDVSRVAGKLVVAVDASRLPNRHGIYRADVAVDCPGAANSPQVFSVKMEVPRPKNAPSSSITIDNRDDGCYATPWFWLTPPFHHHFPGHWRPGHHGDYLINGGTSPNDEFVRFTPDLRAGKYTIALADATPFRPSSQAPGESRFAVRVRHKHRTEIVSVEPLKSREIGSFEFDEGTAGYVEILAEGSTGMVVADAVHFERQPD